METPRLISPSPNRERTPGLRRGLCGERSVFNTQNPGRLRRLGNRHERRQLGIAGRIVWRDELSLRGFQEELAGADVVCDQLGEAMPGMVAVDAMAMGLPVVATNDAHFLRDTDHDAHDVLLCIGTGKFYNDPKRMRFSGEEFYAKTVEEMEEREKSDYEMIDFYLAKRTI